MIFNPIWLRQCGLSIKFRIEDQLIETTRIKSHENLLNSLFNEQGLYDCKLLDKHLRIDLSRRDLLKVDVEGEVRSIDFATRVGLAEGGNYSIRQHMIGMLPVSSKVIAEFNGLKIFELRVQNWRDIITQLAHWSDFIKMWEVYGEVTSLFDLERDFPILLYAVVFGDIGSNPHCA